MFGWIRKWFKGEDEEKVVKSITPLYPTNVRPTVGGNAADMWPPPILPHLQVRPAHVVNRTLLNQQGRIAADAEAARRRRQEQDDEDAARRRRNEEESSSSFLTGAIVGATVESMFDSSSSSSSPSVDSSPSFDSGFSGGDSGGGGGGDSF